MCFDSDSILYEFSLKPIMNSLALAPTQNYSFRIGIGIILSGKSDSSEDITSLVLQGMAAGTLLYVVFFEVLAREREKSAQRCMATSIYSVWICCDAPVTNF
ncbi:hypothetical protein NQ317_009200 [Molorchus minor]|uniref:Uncharacterized protein n=1 Tax=Molorchus minor TaxID=1323400 RepID=A0ABQ9JBL6_9CUCU|nr:hypothetical protein NQ317_009200 [Molorchus minor]